MKLLMIIRIIVGTGADLLILQFVINVVYLVAIMIANIVIAIKFIFMIAHATFGFFNTVVKIIV